MRILIVEDEAALAARIVANLERYGMVCEHVASADDAAGFADEDFNALIVDLGLPGMSGLELIRSLPAGGVATPVLILTARSSWQEKVEGLNAGADDYLVKPVMTEELVARLHALARRSQGHASPELKYGDFTFDPGAQQIRMCGESLALTATEYRLLALFLSQRGRTLSQGKILDHLYPLGKERDLNTVEVHIGRLRRKLGRERIQTVRGLGYRLQP